MILIVSSVFPPEPVVSANIGHDLALALAEKWQVTALTPRPTRPLGFQYKAAPENHGFEHVVLDSYTFPSSRLFGRLRESYSFGKHVRNFIREHHREIECIYIHSWPLFGQSMIVKEAKKFGIPSVTHVVDIYPEALSGKLPVFEKAVNRLLLPIDKYALQNSSMVVTISPKMRDHLAKTRELSDKQIDVVYNWQNEEIFLNHKKSTERRAKEGPFTFMFLGNLNRTAAIHLLIKAFSQSGLKDARLVIAGNGSQKEMLMEVAHSFADCRIEFMDAPMSKVPEIQDQADVLLLSLYKGAARFALPSKLPAYMFSEKPILATVDAESDSAGIIGLSKCGWIVEPENTEALTEAMKNAAVCPPATLQVMGLNGFRFALENFSRSGNLKKFTSIIESVIS